MIQRIQSIWLFIAFLLVIVSTGLFVNQVFLTAESTDVVYMAFRKYNVILGVIFPLFLLIASLLSLIGLFMFKNRMKQVRLVVFSQLFIVLAYVVYLITFLINSLPLELGVILILPLLAFVFLIMARKAIIKDEKLVRSADRIRQLYILFLTTLNINSHG